MPPINPFLHLILSARQCTAGNPADCESLLLTDGSSGSLPIVSIFIIALACLTGLSLLIAYFRHVSRTPERHHTGSLPNRSSYRPDSWPSYHHATASVPGSTGLGRQQRPSKAKTFNFIDPPPAYGLESLSHMILEQAPGLMVIAAPRDSAGGGEELLAPLKWRERARDFEPTYSVDERIYRRERPAVVDARSGVVVKAKDISDGETEAGAGPMDKMEPAGAKKL